MAPYLEYKVRIRGHGLSKITISIYFHLVLTILNLKLTFSEIFIETNKFKAYDNFLARIR